jgi:hypothetical protein
MVMRQYIIMYVDTLGIERALHFEEASTNHLTNNEVVLRNQHTAVIPFFGVGVNNLKNLARVLPSGVNVVHGVVPTFFFMKNGIDGVYLLPCKRPSFC